MDIKELAEKLGVSRTPVKDAINRLASEGLVELKPRRGTFVAELSARDVAETFEVRLALECLAAEIAIESITDDDILRFKEIMAAMEIPVTNERERAFHRRKNTDFHRLLVELSGNRKLLDIYDSIHVQVKFARIRYDAAVLAKHLEDEKEQHREIFTALQDRDSPRLIKLLKKHIRSGAQSVVEEINKAGR